MNGSSLKIEQNVDLSQSLRSLNSKTQLNSNSELSITTGLLSMLTDWVVLPLLLIGTYIRFDFLIASNWVIDSDEAIIGLMAKHILEGKEIPIFFYGQHYMGSLESIFAAFSFFVFGVTPFALKLVPAIFSILLLPLLYLLGFCIGQRSVARLSLLLAAAPPSALVLWSGMARGGFIEILFIGALALLGMISWLRCKEPGLVKTSFIWFMLGLGWWVNNQIIFFILPIALWGTLSLNYIIKNSGPIRIIEHLVWSIAAFTLGSLPFWIYNIQYNFVSFEMLSSADSKGITNHLVGFFDQALPILLGAKRFWQANEIFPYSASLAYAVFIILFLSFIVIRRRAILNLFFFKIDRIQPLELFLVIGLMTAAIFITSSFGHLVSAPRYLLPLYVIGIPLIAYTLAQLDRRVTHLAKLLLILILSLSVSSSYFGGRALAGQPFVFKEERASKDHTDLINWLNQNNYKSVRTNYWIGYRLAFETNEQITFSLFHEPHQLRLPQYETFAQSLNTSEQPFVLVSGQAEIVENALKALNINYRSQIISGYTVLDKFDSSFSGISFGKIDSVSQNMRVVPRSSFKAVASNSNQMADLAVDGDTTTRWGSAHPQVPGMTFEVVFTSPKQISGLSYSLAGWYHDAPRGLMIEVERNDGDLEKVFTAESYSAVQYLLDGSPIFSLQFKPIKAKRLILTQTGSDPIFDWSLAELVVFEKS